MQTIQIMSQVFCFTLQCQQWCHHGQTATLLCAPQSDTGLIVCNLSGHMSKFL